MGKGQSENLSDQEMSYLDSNFSNDESAYLDQMMSGNDSASQESKGYTGPGSGALQTIADYAPAALGLAGAALAGPALVPAAAMAMVGAAAGTGYRRLIEENILKTKDPTERSGRLGLTDVTDMAGNEGAGTVVGAGLVKGASKIVNSKAGQAIGDKISKFADEPLSYVKNTMQTVRDKIEEPLLKMISEKTSSLNTRQTGDKVKELLANDISTRFSKFTTANKSLNEVAKALPLRDEPRLKFFQESRDWALNTLGMDNQKLADKWLNNLLESQSLAQFQSVRNSLNVAFKDAAETFGSKSAQTRTLETILDRADDFMESQVKDLATRISKGTASMPEMQAFQKMMGLQRNPNVPADPKNLTKYAKSVADDYLSGKESVKKYYSKFKGFLGDVGEQTRVSSTRGTEDFIRQMDKVPSEKLVERMFDPKNSRALEKMSKETPEVFNQVVQSKMNQIIQKASPDGVLDIAKVRTEILKMPQSTRNFLMSPDEIKVMNSVLDSPRRQRIAAVQKLGEKAVGEWVGALYELTNVAGQGAAKAVSKSPVAKQMIGKGAMSLGEAFMPGISPAE